MILENDLSELSLGGCIYYKYIQIYCSIPCQTRRPPFRNQLSQVDVSKGTKHPWDACHHFGTPETRFIDNRSFASTVGTWLSGPENLLQSSSWSDNNGMTRFVVPEKNSQTTSWCKGHPRNRAGHDYKRHVWKRWCNDTWWGPGDLICLQHSTQHVQEQRSMFMKDVRLRLMNLHESPSSTLMRVTRAKTRVASQRFWTIIFA